jgi:hypothetical protein
MKEDAKMGDSEEDIAPRRNVVRRRVKITVARAGGGRTSSDDPLVGR